MPVSKKCLAGLRDSQGLSSEQPEPGSSLSTRGADSTCRPKDDSYTEGTAPGAYSSSCPGLLQPAQNDIVPEGIDPGSCQILPGSEANLSLGPRQGGQSSLNLQDTSSSGKLKVRLCNHSLWLQFSRQQNEMILSKQGRNMFPFLVYKIQGMDPRALYHVFVAVEPVDKHHWQYQRGQWLPHEDKKEDGNLPGNRFYQHPDSPNTGALWMDREIAFTNLKLTNKETACKNGSQAPILLKSLHKYQPRLHIEKVSDASSSSRHNFTFPDTEFIAVTAYQNPGIRRLKIQNNPFASGFRGKPSCPGQSLQKSPAAGEFSGCTSSPPALLVSNHPVQVQEGPAQDKDCDLMSESQPPSGHLYDYRDSSSTTSLVLPLTVEGLNPKLLPCTSPNDMSYQPNTDSPITQGNWPLSFSIYTSNGNSTDGLWPECPKPLQAGTGTEEEERLQEQLCPPISSSPSDVSHLEQRPKKRSLSLVDSVKDSSPSAWKIRAQEDKFYLVASESSGNSSQEAVSEGSTSPTGSTVGQEKEKMNPIPWDSFQETQQPSDLPFNSNIFEGILPGIHQFFPSTSPPAMPYPLSTDTSIIQGNWPHSLSTCTSNGNRVDCFLPIRPKPQQGIEEEDRLQEQLFSSSLRYPFYFSHLGERTCTKRCSSLVDSAKISLDSAWKIRGQEDKYLVAHKSSANSSQELISEDCSYPVVLQEDTGQPKENMNSAPWHSIQENQPPSEFDFDSNFLDLVAVINQIFPSTSPPAMTYEPNPYNHITQGNWSPSFSNCISNGNSMESFQSGNAKPQQTGTGTEEEERLEEQLFSSSFRHPSDFSHLGQRSCTKRCSSSVGSAKDSLHSAWKTWEQEDKCLVVSETSGNSSQEAIPEASCYSVVLQEDIGQAKEKMNPTPWDSILETQTLSEISFDSTLYDEIHQFLPSFSLPAMPCHTSPDTLITQGRWTPAISPCTSNQNHMDFFQSGSPMPQQEDPGTEGERKKREETLQEQL